MPTTLKQEIDAITADRMEIERRNPGFFWDDEDGGRKLTREESQGQSRHFERAPRSNDSDADRPHLPTEID